MRVAPHGWLWGLAALVWFAASCSLIPPPHSDTTRYFLLTAVDSGGTERGTSATGAVNQLAIGLGPIGFPDYLARTEIVTRAADNRLELSSTDRWAEPLDVTFKRVLAHDLTVALGGAQVTTFPWFGASPRFDYRIEPTIDRFEVDAQGVAHLAARWTVLAGVGGRMLYSSMTDLRIQATSTDPAALAAALSQAEGGFAGEIAGAIRRLHGGA
jgi:uncharacterized lipoprotein YmbA